MAGIDVKMFGLARLLFFVAWVCPTVALIGGDLPADRIVAAFMAAAVSGAALSALPPAGFRAVRALAVFASPLCLLWIGYVSLNGMGPTPNDALGTLANTNLAEAMTATRLLLNGKSVSIGLLQIGLLVISYVSGGARPNGYARAILATSLFVLMLNAWLPRILVNSPSFLPGRDDLLDFPYGSMLDMVSTAIDDRSVFGMRSDTGAKRRMPTDPVVHQSIDAIFVLGESHRFDRPLDLGYGGPGWIALNERFRTGLGVFLPKVCASADATAVSVPMLLSGTPPQRYADVATAPSGLARLAVAGYETAWISNQGSIFFGDEHRDLVWLAKGYANQYDDALLPIAAAFLNRSSHRNKALLIHLMDSHAAYEDRYPPMPEPKGLDPEHREALRYQRANDHALMLLAKVAAMIDAVTTPAFAVYVADHGENLLTDHNGIHYHIGARTTARAAYVPSIVLWNSAFLRAFNPGERLRPVVAAGSMAHADVYSIWMNFAGLQTDISATPEPEILGKAKLTDPVAPIRCSKLSP